MITKLSIANIEEIIRIEQSSFDNPWTRNQFINSYKKFNKYLNYVYNDTTKVVGYLISEIILDEVHLYKIVVSKNNQNNKVGSKLLKFMIFDNYQKAILVIGNFKLIGQNKYQNKVTTNAVY